MLAHWESMERQQEAAEAAEHQRLRQLAAEVKEFNRLKQSQLSEGARKERWEGVQQPCVCSLRCCQQLLACMCCIY